MRERYTDHIGRPGKFEGEGPMTAYVYELVMGGDRGDDEDCSASGDSAVRFGRRILFEDSRGFVSLAKYDTEAEAIGTMSALHDEWDEEGDPRIYVASLADYNAGRLHGAWIDAAQDADAIQEEVNAMLAKSPEPIAEEWAIHDHEGFGGLKFNEWESFERVSAIAQAMEEHGEGPIGAYLADYPDADLDDFEETYAGEYDSEEAFADELLDIGVFGEIPEHLEPYIDTERIARDLFMGDYWSAQSDTYTVYVFRRI